MEYRLNLLKILEKLPRDPIIVEISMRHQMTILFTSFVENKTEEGLFYSVDNSWETIKENKELMDLRGIVGKGTRLVLCDGLEFFRNLGSLFPGTIDLLYLDGPDYLPNGGSPEWHRKCFDRAKVYLSEKAFILIDDIFDLGTFKGKGEILIPYLLKNGYQIVESDYQVLLQKSG